MGNTLNLGGWYMYDYLVVGAGLYGAVFAQQAKEKGKKFSDSSVVCE